MLLSRLFDRENQLLDKPGLLPAVGDRQHSSQLADVSEVCTHPCMLESAEVPSDPLLNQHYCSQLYLPLDFPLFGLVA